MRRRRRLAGHQDASQASSACNPPGLHLTSSPPGPCLPPCPTPRPFPRSGRAFNTGLFAARNCPPARAFLAAWADMLTDPEHERHTDAARRGIDDQMALNLLFQSGSVAGAGEGERDA